MFKFGLLGRNISYSFSKKYFTEKFKKESLLHSYENFDIPSIEHFPEIINRTKELKGLSVTIPYKQEVIQFLHKLDKTASEIGAVNTIKISNDGSLEGFNTDYWGFQKALEEFLPLKQKKALILGTGGASKAIAFALDQMGFQFKFVSRTKSDDNLTYLQLDKKLIEEHSLLINCSPVGTSPNVTECPSIPYEYLGSYHLLFDLIYNPAETEFLRRGKLQGAKTTNGLKMLEYQAEKAWEIWNS